MARDMTEKQFREALKRNGFAHDFLFWFRDTTGQTPGNGYPGVCRRDGTWKRRETVAKLIAARAAEVRRKETDRRRTKAIMEGRAP